ncbi:hypothetical protein H9P43_007109 [Blastocladiella emersonii ATCC 22665]|nr:hypothetical protein H9P43_007109 [Blastocladiella emersonii ATCC 22665]
MQHHPPSRPRPRPRAQSMPNLADGGGSGSGVWPSHWASLPPQQYVDYLHHPWTDEELTGSWKLVTKLKNGALRAGGKGERLEYLTWRIWIQRTRKLPKTHPYTIHWEKDATHLYAPGPIFRKSHIHPDFASATTHSPPSPSTLSHSGCLKRHTLRELLQRTADGGWLHHDDDGDAADAVKPASPLRPRHHQHARRGVRRQSAEEHAAAMSRALRVASPPPAATAARRPSLFAPSVTPPSSEEDEGSDAETPRPPSSTSAPPNLVLVCTSTATHPMPVDATWHERYGRGGVPDTVRFNHVVEERVFAGTQIVAHRRRRSRSLVLAGFARDEVAGAVPRVVEAWIGMDAKVKGEGPMKLTVPPPPKSLRQPQLPASPTSSTTAAAAIRSPVEEEFHVLCGLVEDLLSSPDAEDVPPPPPTPSPLPPPPAAPVAATHQRQPSDPVEDCADPDPDPTWAKEDLARGRDHALPPFHIDTDTLALLALPYATGVPPPPLPPASPAPSAEPPAAQRRRSPSRPRDPATLARAVARGTGWGYGTLDAHEVAGGGLADSLPGEPPASAGEVVASQQAATDALATILNRASGAPSGSSPSPSSNPNITAIVNTAAAAAVRYLPNNASGARARPHSYLIGIKDECSSAAGSLETMRPLLQAVGVTAQWGFNVMGVRGLKVTYSGPSLPVDLLAGKVPCVAYIEDDAGFDQASEASGFAVTENACLQSPAMPNKEALWGLDAMDGALDGTYGFDLAGDGVNVYVIDSGINDAHPEFDGRASNIYTSQSVREAGQKETDCTGHGTHVASVIAGTTVGIAKKARVHGLRIIGCDKTGSVSDAVDALNFLAQNIKKPAVINMSLGSTESLRGNTLPNAIAAMTRAGVPVVIAAGNSGVDICQVPAGTPSMTNVPNTFVVGALDRSSASATAQGAYAPRIATFSNRGDCLKYWAPGVAIWGATNFTANVNGAANAFEQRQGTSQAAPFVAGVLALHLGANASATPADLTAKLSAAATPLAFGGGHVVVPRAAALNAKATVQQGMAFPLAQCSVSATGVLAALSSALGTSRGVVVSAIVAVVVVVLGVALFVVVRRRRARSAKAQAMMVSHSPDADRPLHGQVGNKDGRRKDEDRGRFV